MNEYELSALKKFFLIVCRDAEIRDNLLNITLEELNEEIKDAHEKCRFSKKELDALKKILKEDFDL